MISRLRLLFFLIHIHLFFFSYVLRLLLLFLYDFFPFQSGFSRYQKRFMRKDQLGEDRSQYFSKEFLKNSIPYSNISMYIDFLILFFTPIHVVDQFILFSSFALYCLLSFSLYHIFSQDLVFGCIQDLFSLSPYQVCLLSPIKNRYGRIEVHKRRYRHTDSQHPLRGFENKYKVLERKSFSYEEYSDFLDCLSQFILSLFVYFPINFFIFAPLISITTRKSLPFTTALDLYSSDLVLISLSYSHFPLYLSFSLRPPILLPLLLSLSHPSLILGLC